MGTLNLEGYAKPMVLEIGIHQIANNEEVKI